MAATWRFERPGRRHLPGTGPNDPDRAEDGTFLVDDDFLVLVNSWWEPLDFALPATKPEALWRVEIDSHDPAASAGVPARAVGDQVTVGPRSVPCSRTCARRRDR